MTRLDELLTRYLEETEGQQKAKQRLARKHGVWDASLRSNGKEICGKKLMKNLKAKGLSDEELKRAREEIK